MHLLHSDLVYLHLQVITLVSSLRTPASFILVTQPTRSIWESAILSIHHVLLQVSHSKANVTLAGTAHTTRSEISGGESQSVHIESPALLGMSLRGIIQPLDVSNMPTVSIALDGRSLRATKRQQPRVQHGRALRQPRVRPRVARLLAGGAVETELRLVVRLYLRPPSLLHHRTRDTSACNRSAKPLCNPF
jgi:hypothetical protein